LLIADRRQLLYFQAMTDDERPPLWGSWRRIYLAVALYTCALIVLLYWATVSFNH
jgi:hypothetical protein